MYLGIDLAFPHKPVAYCLLGAEATLTDLGTVSTDEQILMLAAGSAITAIDAPLFLPSGWRCLDNPCSCSSCNTPDSARRSAERILFNRGIRLYWTTRRSFIRPLIQRGVSLESKLAAMGVRTVEIYPYATKRLLFGAELPNKKCRAGRLALRKLLQPLVSGLADFGRLPSHDELDAVLAAYTAYLLAQGAAEAVGDPSEGSIIVPLSHARP